MNTLSKVVAFLISMLLMFYVPLLYTFEHQDSIVRLNVQNTVTKFVDSVRYKGFITPTMYNQFAEEIGKYGYLFEIEMVHEQKNYYPIYTDPTDESTFQNNFKVDYENFYSAQINKILFPTDNPLSLEDEKRKYKLMVGDYFNVQVTNKNRTKSLIMKDFLSFGNSGDLAIIKINYGGMVHNEDY